MTASRQRELVIEFDKVQLIRKRAKTRLIFCEACGTVSDVISHLDAAGLFETTAANIVKFIKENNCHPYIVDKSNIYVCVVSLLESMRQKSRRKRCNRIPDSY